MREWIASGLIVGCLMASGCTQNPFSLKHQNNTLQQKMAEIENRNRELETRAGSLDNNNNELNTQVAHAQQQNKLLDDQLAAVKDQLNSATQQIAQLRTEKRSSPLEKPASETLPASMQRRPAAVITANNSLIKALPMANLPGLEVRQDGDVIRIELPNNRLFEANSANLSQQGMQLLDSVANEIARAYPQQLIAVEGHTDAEVRGSAAQQVSNQNATAVYQHLTTQGQIPGNQLFVVSHGANHPVVSNATPQGKERNNRVELVVYPERRP